VTLSTKGRKCSCIRTIIIDDEYINIMAMQMLLRGFGIAVDHAYDGIEGTQKVIQRLQNPCKICGSAYILVLMDIDMPGINGFEATKRIVSFCELTLQRKPIIIAQTAFVDAESQNQCFTVGMNHFLSKPISKTELRNALTFFEMI
jgi:CheY-like chemotaxis protein